MGFGGAKQQVPSPWGEKQFKLPTCGPLLIWGPPRWQGLCSHSAQLWALSDFVPRFEALETPPMGGVM